MKYKFVFSQTAWDRFKFFVRGPSSIVHQSMAEAIAYRDNTFDPALKKLLNAYITGCETAVGIQGNASRDENLSQKIIRGEENLTTGLSYWAKKQIDILKADGRGRNAQAFETLNKISDRASALKKLEINPFTPSDTQKPTSSEDTKAAPKQNSNNKKFNITTKPNNPKAPISNTEQSPADKDNKNNIKIKPNISKSPVDDSKNNNPKVPISNPKQNSENKDKRINTNVKPDISEPPIYNNRNNNPNSNESSKSKVQNNTSSKMEGSEVEDIKKPTDYSDYFNQIKTGNDFLFLAISKVFPEIQTYGKDPKLKSKIEDYWKIENKEKIKNKLEEIAKNPWIERNYPHIPVLLPEAIKVLDQKMSLV